MNNCYSSLSRLFIIGEYELKSKQGTTQGDPVAMAIYAIAIIPMILMLVDIVINHQGKMRTLAFADDLSASRSAKGLKHWWDTLEKLGPKFGYYPQPSKSWLIIKPGLKADANKIFRGTDINITEKGQRHLGAVIGFDRITSPIMYNVRC